MGSRTVAFPDIPDHAYVSMAAVAPPRDFPAALAALLWSDDLAHWKHVGSIQAFMGPVRIQVSQPPDPVVFEMAPSPPDRGLCPESVAVAFFKVAAARAALAFGCGKPTFIEVHGGRKRLLELLQAVPQEEGPQNG